MNSQDVLNYILAFAIILVFGTLAIAVWRLWQILSVFKPILKWQEVMSVVRNQGIHPVIAGVTGAALGAVAGLALSDRGNRRKLGTVVRQARLRGEEVYHEVRGEGKRRLKKVKARK